MTPRTEWADEMPALAIAHDIPGRLRLRLPPGRPSAGLCEAIERLRGVQSCVWSPRTRSLLIRYDPDGLTGAEITRAVAEHAEVSMPVADTRRSVAISHRHGPIAGAVTQGFGAIDQGVVRATGGRLDLSMVMSLGLLLWGARQLVRGPITALSWTSALWYAHGLFRDYHTTRE